MIEMSTEERARVITTFVLTIGVGLAAAAYALWPLIKLIKRKMTKSTAPPPLPRS